tara:strand:+ start:3774 stop:4535 length:762 start_codon:yes stop_codon:yes gene_type:complete
MKNIYLFFLIFISYSVIQGQTIGCSDADSDLIYAYSNVKSAYEANNISHLKYYSDKSLKSFEKAKINLKKCGCDAAFDLAFKASELLAKVEPAETFEDGRFFVKRAKEIAQNCITELNKCTIPTVDTSISNAENSNDALNALQLEKDKLEQQRLELKLKEDEIIKKLNDQKQEALQSQKETFIKQHEDMLNSNIKMCNEVLKMYNSTSELPIYDKKDAPLLSESLNDIKAYFLNITKTTNALYLEKLNLCKVN